MIAIFVLAIIIWEAIQKKSNEPIYKSYTKNEAKGLRLKSDNFAIAKLQER